MNPTAVIGWRCVVCGATVDISEALVFRCPRATADDPFHTLQIVQHDELVHGLEGEPNPFIAFQRYLAWDAFGDAVGLSFDDRRALVADVDSKVAAIAGTGLVITPFIRADALSVALGFSDAGGIWIKDETHQVAGSHKARHLFSTLLHLLIAERIGHTPWGDRIGGRPTLAIASCGNAALAASTLAAAVDWPIQVFVPPNANPNVVTRLNELGASVTTCPRRVNDPPGDPCVLRYREAVNHGAIPFSVQGPENGWCLDGGRSIGWEMAGTSLDRVVVQVGGGALARCTIGGLAQATAELPALLAVQTEACAPLARAWRRALDGPGGIATAASRWRECMTPWETEPYSAAEGILDDETYDWLGIVNGLVASGGSPVIASEADVLRANVLAGQHTTIDASHTGTAGLAGLLAARGDIRDDERVGVIFSGVRR
jgi:threonine synthase